MAKKSSTNTGTFKTPGNKAPKRTQAKTNTGLFATAGNPPSVRKALAKTNTGMFRVPGNKGKP